jgi:hypothetical protein
MHDTEPNTQSTGGADEPSETPQLRRRENRPVEFERRRNRGSGIDIAAVLEMHLDQCKTRRSMIALLEQWLSEAQARERENQDPEYIGAVERAIEVMKGAPDVETGIFSLQQR